MKPQKYETMIMSWSCFGDFILVAQSMHTLIQSGVIKKGVIISHQKEFEHLLEKNSNIRVVYPTKKVADFLYLIFLCFRRNIFVLQDMPSHNKFTRELRLVMSIFLTVIPRSKLLLLIDVDIKPSVTTHISKFFSTNVSSFDKKTKTHISQYMLDILHSASITPKLTCNYTLLPVATKPDTLYGEYLVLHPFAGGKEKSPSLDWWKNLLHTTENTFPHFKIIITGSQHDRKGALEILKDSKNGISLCGDLNFNQTVHVLKTAKAMVSVDTGPMHYAALHGVKQVLIWMHPNYTYMPVFNPQAYIVNANSIFQANTIYNEEHIFTLNINSQEIISSLDQLLKSSFTVANTSASSIK